MFFPPLPANEEGKRLVSQRYAATSVGQQHSARSRQQPAEKRTKVEPEMAP